MSEIEKMEQYIARTRAENIRYDMNMVEALNLAAHAKQSDDLPIGIINLAFKYGKAKGYRMAIAEVKRA